MTREELITNKRYRLTLSVWLDRGEDTTELREQRRTVQYILSPNLLDTPKEYEKDVIMEMCEKFMEQEGIKQTLGSIRCKHCEYAEARADGSYYCRAMPIKDSFDCCSRARRKEQ